MGLLSQAAAGSTPAAGRASATPSAGGLDPGRLGDFIIIRRRRTMMIIVITIMMMMIMRSNCNHNSC